MKDKTYKITFSADYTQYEKWSKEKGEDPDFWAREVIDHPKELAICKKWKGKTIKLSQFPEFIEEVGEIIVDDDTVEIYNDYRE